MDYHRYLLAVSAAVFSTEHRRVTARNLLATELKNADVTVTVRWARVCTLEWFVCEWIRSQTSCRFSCKTKSFTKFVNDSLEDFQPYHVI